MGAGQDNQEIYTASLQQEERNQLHLYLGVSSIITTRKIFFYLPLARL